MTPPEKRRPGWRRAKLNVLNVSQVYERRPAASRVPSAIVCRRRGMKLPVGARGGQPPRGGLA